MNSGVAMSPVQAGEIPRNVFLFSGHMVDAADRKTPRFPPDKESVAAAAIEETLLGLAPNVATVQFAVGHAAGICCLPKPAWRLTWRLSSTFRSMNRPSWPTRSISPTPIGTDAILRPNQERRLHVMPDELGPLPAGENPYERINRWMLQSAARFGGEKIAFIALWNGEGGDGPGGTKHFMDEARRKTERIYWLDTRKLWD
jgi:hypothetical protein